MTQPIIAGMAWYKAADYERILQIMEDAARLPKTYKNWLQQAEVNEKDANQRGYITVRAFIDPETFPDWCRGNGHRINAEARKEFAGRFARESAKNMNT